MTDEELREWRDREIRAASKRKTTPGVEPLAPPSAFSDAYAPEHPEVKGGADGIVHGQGPARRRLLRLEPPARRGGAVRRDAHPAADAPAACRRGAAFIGEAGIDDLLMAHLEGAFTWRQLAAMLHRLGMETSELSPYLNRWTGGAERPSPSAGRTRGAGRG